MLGPAPDAAAPFPRARIQAVLNAAFATILERHLEAVAPADLVLWSLRGLGVLDGSITAEIRNGEIRLSGGDQVFAAQPVPPALPAILRAPGSAMPDQLAQAAQVAGAPAADSLALLLAAAWNRSGAVRAAGAERVLQSGFEELFNHLDPYSRYITPDEARGVQARRIGIEGLGLRLAAARGTVLVTDVAPGGPAARAGLRAGDRLYGVDDTAVDGNDLQDAEQRLEGPHESRALLSIGRGRRRWSVLLMRSIVPPETVQSTRDGDLLMLRITSFSNATAQTMAASLADNFVRRPPRGVVLDLRGNRGGLLDQAVEVANAFLDGGEVARTDGRHPESRRIYLAGNGDLTRGRPVVVLVDGRTASAAEIVAAALGDRGRAAVVGSATTGKGLIQVVMPMPNGGELLVTWSRVLAPDGWPLQGLGVLPELCTSLGADEIANQSRDLRAGTAPMAAPLGRERAARAPVPASEIAALRGSCPPAEGRNTDLPAARLLINNRTAYETAVGR